MTTFFETNKRTFTTALYILIALLLLIWLAPIIGGQRPARLIQSSVTGLLVGGLYLFGAVGNFWANDGRHPGWMLMAAALMLIGIGVG